MGEVEGLEVSGAVTTIDIRNVVVKAAEFAREHGCDIDVALVVRGFDNWLAEHDRALSERRWAEGFEAGQDEADGHQASRQWGGPHTCITNRYCKESE